MAQGTIQEFDDDSRQGQLLLDDRSEVRIDATSLQGSGVRSLRLGQRVKFDVVEEGGQKIARSLRIVTF